MTNFCKIVQDLLPNYMEKITSDETNQFVEKHLEQCEECTRIYNNMKSNLEVPTENIDKGVDYMKKFNKEVKHLKFWKKILIVIALIIGILAGIVLYRYSVLTKMYNLYEKGSKEITNIHCIQEFSDAGSTTITEAWRKDNLEIEKLTKVGTEYELRVWLDRKTNEEYFIIENEKKYQKTGLPMISIPAMSTFANPGIEYRLKDAINPTISIKSIEYEGKDCYQIKQDIEGLSFDREVIYEKQTGFPLYVSTEGSKSEGDTTWSQREIKYKYEINAVTDEDVAKPDFTEYEYIED